LAGKTQAEMMAEMALFRLLIRRKYRFLVRAIACFMAFYFILPVSIGLFPHWMSLPSPFWDLPWGWLFAFAQLVMTWFFAWLYWRKSKSFDRLVEEIRQGIRR